MDKGQTIGKFDRYYNMKTYFKMSSQEEKTNGEED